MGFIRGVSLSGEELYIIRWFDDSVHIDVYSISNVTFLHRFYVPGFSQYGVKDFTLCENDRVRYFLIADSKRPLLHVHKVPTMNGQTCHAETQWPLPGRPCAISTVRYGSKGRVIVACCADGLLSFIGKLIELRSDGEHIRTIILQSPINSLWSVRALESGDYLVSYRSFWCTGCETVSKVDDCGKVTESYGDWWLFWGRELLRGECCMAVDSDGFVFVADSENKRILLLNPSLQFVRSIATEFYPKLLHFDSTSQRLFVTSSYFAVRGYEGTVHVFQL